jgi:cytochrome c biogenesis protein CcmG/thiol:disulfide interchange protein DsbE
MKPWQEGSLNMARIHFIAVKAEKLAAVIGVAILAIALIGYLTLFRSGSRKATPVPKALLLRSLPVSTAEEPTPPPVQVGAPAPPFTLNTVDGTPVSLSSLHGKPVLLYFWASWCSFCRDDFPALQQLQDEHKDSGLAILAVNLLEKPELVKAYASQLNLRLPLLLDADGAVSSIYLVRATPTYVFIDRQGIVQAQVVGRSRPAVLESNLAVITSGDEKAPHNSSSPTAAKSQAETAQAEILQPAKPPADVPPTEKRPAEQLPTDRPPAGQLPSI